MTTEQTMTTTAPAPARGLRSKRVRAILAGGLVLGVGAAITLAAWNDSEFVKGIFAGSAFGIEGSTDGTTFAEHPTAIGAAELDFEFNADNLIPAEPVYAGFAVQLTSASTVGASVDIVASSAAPIASFLTYSLVQTATFGCDAATFATGDPLVVGAATTASTATSIFALDEAADPVFLCFEVLPGALPQAAASGTVTWEFDATSTTTIP